MRRIFQLLTPAALVVTAGCDNTTKPSGATTVPVHTAPPISDWEPNARLLEQLGPAADVDAYQLRPPQGYSFVTSPAIAPGAKAFAWIGTRRNDRTVPMLFIGVVSPPAEEANITVEQYLEKRLESVKSGRTSWMQTKPERGRVNGLTFVRSRWSGTDTETQWNKHGIMYATRDGSTFIHLHIQDSEPHHEETLRLAEAAVLTFKRK